MLKHFFDIHTYIPKTFATELPVLFYNIIVMKLVGEILSYACIFLLQAVV